MSKHGRVLVAMSGGVDSSVAAVLLKEEGYEVVGITMKTWDYGAVAPSTSGKQVGCCTLESMNDARGVAVKHDFTHFVVDIREEFGDWVIDKFTDEYLSGRTPNPCVLCNTHIKWSALMRRANALDCATIATGHYARLRHDKEVKRHVLMEGLDTNKDQSYALWGVSQEHFARTLLPLGPHRKPRIREMAAEFGLLRVAQKPDSYEICFVPDNDYRRFLRDRVPDLDSRIGPGPMKHVDGRDLGQHEGFPFYTIGQRHGLGLAMGHPVYVTHIDAETNTITVGPAGALGRHKLSADGLNLIKFDELIDTHPATAKVRYKDPGAPCLITQTGPGSVDVTFLTSRKAIAPGQAVVMYEGEDVLGGAWIRSVEEPEAGHVPG